MLVGTSVDVDGEILVITGVDGALNENEYVPVWVDQFSLGLSDAWIFTVTSFSIS